MQKVLTVHYYELSPDTCETGLSHKEKKQVPAKMWRKRSPCILLVGPAQPLWQTARQFLKVLNTELIKQNCGPEILILGDLKSRKHFSE